MHQKPLNVRLSAGQLPPTPREHLTSPVTQAVYKS